METLLNLKEKFLDFASPARRYRRATIGVTQRPVRDEGTPTQPKHQRAIPASTGKPYRVDKSYKALKRPTRTKRALDDGDGEYEPEPSDGEGDDRRERKRVRRKGPASSNARGKDSDDHMPSNMKYVSDFGDVIRVDNAPSQSPFDGDEKYYQDGSIISREDVLDEGDTYGPDDSGPYSEVDYVKYAENGDYERGSETGSEARSEDPHFESLEDILDLGGDTEMRERMKNENWSDDEIELWTRLRNRGREPMLPIHWNMDFKTIPGHLFGPEDQVMINSISGNTFRAGEALQRLFKIGQRVRPRLDQGYEVESVIKSEIEHYIRWSQEDGDYAKKPFIPVLAIVAAKPGQKPEALERRMICKLKALARRYRTAYTETSANGTDHLIRPIPTFYGIIISDLVMGFVTYNGAAGELAQPRSIGVFDYSEHFKDVWNGIAIAYMVISARNYLVDVLQEVQELEIETDDPDA